MKKLFALAVFASLALFFSCSSSKDSTELKNEFRVGNKYPCPLKLLSEIVMKNRIYVYLDGGSSTPDISSGKWSGNGPRMMFVFKRVDETKTNIPIGTQILGDNIEQIQYCEDFNNDGEGYLPVYDFKDGILKSAQSGTSYIFEFTGVDQNDSVVVMKFSDPVSYLFDWADEIDE